MIGPTIVARSAFGSQPTSMNRAVSSPHAISAGMLGMIMLDRNVPNFCTWTLAPEPVRGRECCGHADVLQSNAGVTPIT